MKGKSTFQHFFQLQRVLTPRKMKKIQIGQKSVKDTYMKVQMRRRTPLGSVSAKNAARLEKMSTHITPKKKILILLQRTGTSCSIRR